VKVALVSHRILPHRGGIETHVYHVSRELALRGHLVTVFTQHAEPSQTWWTSDGVEVCASRIWIGREAYPVAPGLWGQLSRNGGPFDIVHAHNYHGIAALAASLSRRQPFIFTPHYHGTGHTAFACRLHSIYRPFGRGLFARAARVICVSDAERLLLIHDHPAVTSKTVVIPNGVAALTSAVPMAWVRREKVVVYVGRLEPYKHLDLVIAAISELPAYVRLVVVGTGREESRLASEVTRLRLAHRVTLAGGLTDEAVAQLLAKARVVVTASEREAFGMVILEARQAGARVVASALPAHREVAQLDSAEGVQLWHPDTATKGLAHALRRALEGSDPGVLTVAPRWPDVAAATEEVYLRAIAARSSGPLATVTRGPHSRETIR
jgi:glycosyltransferase involved in cell wall biosynthesis